MGMDIVELVIRTEEEFGIDIPDEMAEKLVTVGDLADCVQVCLKLATGENVWARRSPERVRRRVRAIVVHQQGLRRSQVVDSARFVDDLGMD